MTDRFYVLVDGREPSRGWRLTAEEAGRVAASFRRTRPDSVVEVKSREELDSARRGRDEAMAKLAEYKRYAFGNGLLKYCGVDDLPFLVRCAMGQAVKRVFAEWQAAGSPQDVPTLKKLFPREEQG